MAYRSNAIRSERTAVADHLRSLAERSTEADHLRAEADGLDVSSRSQIEPDDYESQSLQTNSESKKADDRADSDHEDEPDRESRKI